MHKLIAAIVATLILFSPPVGAETELEKIGQAGVLKLGYRENSPPFSFLAVDGQPIGYSIDLCKRVAADLANHLRLNTLRIQWVPVDAATRFPALKNGEIDLLCGNTTQTLSRRADFDFSLMTFVDGAGLLYRNGEKPANPDDLKGHRFVVVAGTTTAQVLEKLVGASKLGAQLIKVRDHDAAMAALKERVADAYAADRTVLIVTALSQGGSRTFELANVQFNYEPYGLAMRRNADLRLLVDRTLARLYRSGEIESILGRWFSQVGNLTEAMEAMIQLNALPE